MPKLPPLKEIKKFDLQRAAMHEDASSCILRFDNDIKSIKQSTQKSSKSSKDDRVYSPCRKSRRKGLRTPNGLKRGSLRGAELLNGYFLPTISENNPEKATENSRSKFRMTSLAKLHEKSFSDKNSMAFWRRYESDSSKDSKPVEGKNSIHLSSSKVFDQDAKPRF